MGVDLGGTDILVSEEFLDGADVLMVFEEMGRPASLRYAGASSG